MRSLTCLPTLLILLLPVGLHAQDRAVRVPGSITITPKGGTSITVAPNSSSYVYFFVQNTRPVVTTANLSCGAAGRVTSCYVDEDQVTLDPNETIDITVDFGTGSTGKGTVSLIAQGFESDSGWRNITVQGVSAPTVTQPRQTDSVASRGNCLTSAAALGTWSCGDGLLMLSTRPGTMLRLC